jgi:hypothetical protein
MVRKTEKKKALGRHSSRWEYNIKIFEVATAVNIETMFFWNVMSCSLTHGYQRFFCPYVASSRFF